MYKSITQFNVTQPVKTWGRGQDPGSRAQALHQQAIPLPGLISSCLQEAWVSAEVSAFPVNDTNRNDRATPLVSECWTDWEHVLPSPAPALTLWTWFESMSSDGRASGSFWCVKENITFHHNLSANWPVAEMIICLFNAVTCGNDSQSGMDRSKTAFTWILSL